METFSMSPKRSRLLLCLLQSRKGQSGAVFILLSVFVMNALLARLLLHRHTQPQQKFSVLRREARSIIHTPIAVLWHREQERGRERGGGGMEQE